MRTCAFLSDFGLKDPYVGIVKGVLLNRISKDVLLNLVDITHEVPFGDVVRASFFLKSSIKFFPEGTLFLAVVDPGVGSSRRGVVATGGGYLFVGPDNGVFTGPDEVLGGLTYREIRCPALYLSDVSSTFHARDIFAPVSAYLLDGGDLERVGPVIEDPVRLPKNPPHVENGLVTGEILFFDRFGNGITNIPNNLVLDGGYSVLDVKDEVLTFVKGYYEIPKGRCAALLGSHGHVEIASFMESAKELLSLNEGDRVVVRISSKEILISCR